MRIAFIPGTVREESLSRKVTLAAAAIATELGHTIDFVDLSNYELPLLGQGSEDEGYPAAAEKLKTLFAAADALIFCSPEYNASITPLLKNMIDWTSLPSAEKEVSGRAYLGKQAAILSTAHGSFGGMRALSHLQAILCSLGVWVSPKQAVVTEAAEKFNENGEIIDALTLTRLRAVIESLRP